MERINRWIDELIESEPSKWSRTGSKVSVVLDRIHATSKPRRQEIRLIDKGEFVALQSVVAKSKELHISSRQDKLNLHKRIMERNAVKQVVALYIDNRDRVIGSTSIHIKTITKSKLEFTLSILARDCDRFEYILHGEDNQ